MTQRPFRNLILISLIIVKSILSSHTAYSQASGNPIIDAAKLKTAIDNLVSAPDSTRAQAVLDMVNANSSKPFATYNEMRGFIKRNNSIFHILDSMLDAVKNPRFKADSISISAEAFISTNAEFQATSLGLPAIDAVGTFIAERFKQELEIAFLQKFKDWLENGKSKLSEPIRVLLPETKTVLVQNEPYNYTVFLETLKESFRKDLNNVPLNIGIYLGGDPFRIATGTPYYFTSLLIYNNIVQIVNGQPIINVLKGLDKDSLLAKSPEKIQSVVHLLSLTSQLLNNPDRPEEWLNPKTIKTNLGKVINIRIFTELFLLKYGTELQEIKVPATSNLYQAIITNKNNLDKILNWVTELSNSYSLVQKDYQRIKDAVDNSRNIPGDAIIGLENSLIVSFKSFFTLKHLGIAIDPSIEIEFNSVVLKVKSFTELVVNIKEKNYGLALTKAIDMLSTFINDNAAINLVKKYGNFAVSVAKAENKNDMLAALRTAALPVGSYRIKRNSFQNISLNAYAGITGGFQTFSSDVPATIKKTNTILGFTAPIGLAYSWGYKKNADSVNGSSGTIFLSMLDIGAVTAFRLTNDETETLPELKWSNLLAPGIYYVHGFKKTPLSAGLGVQYGPEVRSIKDNSAVVLPAAWSGRLFLAVDIPIFNFFSRTEKRERGKNNK